MSSQPYQAFLPQNQTEEIILLLGKRSVEVYLQNGTRLFWPSTFTYQSYWNYLMREKNSQTYYSVGILNKLPLAHWHSNLLETGIVMRRRLWLVYLSWLQLFHPLFTSLRYSINEKFHSICFLLAVDWENYCLIKRLCPYSSFSLEITEQGLDGRVNWKWIVAHSMDFTQPRTALKNLEAGSAWHSDSSWWFQWVLITKPLLLSVLKQDILVTWCKCNLCGSRTADTQWILTSVLSHYMCTKP